MGIQFNANSLSNQQSFFKKEEQGNSMVVNLQKRVMVLDKQIAGIKENESMTAEQKQEKINQIETQKQEIATMIYESQLNEKMHELDEEVEKAEESEAKKKEKEVSKPTPLEKIQAESGLNEVPINALMRASKSVKHAQIQMGVSNAMKQDARILISETKADASRGRMDSYKGRLIAQKMAKASSVDHEALKGLGKANASVNSASDQVEKKQAENEELAQKEMKLVMPGEHVDYTI